MSLFTASIALFGQTAFVRYAPNPQWIASAPRNTTARTKIELISQEKHKYPRTEISHDLLNFHDLPYVEA